MTRASIIASGGLALTLILATAACDKPSDEQQKANAAQAEADKKIAQANKDNAVQTTGAQVEADKKIAAAEAEFGKRREDYRHKVQTDLIDLDKKIDLLDAKAKSATVTGKAKTDLDASLKQIHAQRAAFEADQKNLATTAALDWDNTKARLDNELNDLQKVVDKAR